MSLEKFIQQHQEAFDEATMPETATSDFEARLKKELHAEKGVKRLVTFKYVGIAASVLLLLSIGYFYLNQQQKVNARDHLVLALEEEQTNSERLQTIYEIEENEQYQKEDEKILNAFFKILKEDSDVNSKIAVIEALLKFPNNQQVRTNLIEALEIEQEPLVQLKLINSVAILREQRAKVPLQKIIDNKESLPLVKGNASELLAMLNQ
ncbi:MAG: HEAT repeat domain-containing protein [Bacteroidota bacterium]